MINKEHLKEGKLTFFDMKQIENRDYQYLSQTSIICENDDMMLN